MFRFKTTLIVPAMLVIAGCSSVQQVSEPEAAQYLQQVQSPSYQYEPQRITQWVQAMNKKMPCKIYMGSTAQRGKWWDSPETKIYWDGQCDANGYAYGLGREFIEDSSGLVATIGTYSGGEVEPTYVQATAFDKGMYAFGDLKANKTMTIGVQDSAMGFQMTSILTNQAGVVQYARYEALGVNGVSYVKSFGNGYVFKMTEVKDPGNPLAYTFIMLKNDHETGYRIEKLKNGSTQGVSFMSGQPQIVRLTPSIVNFYQAQVGEILQKLAEAQDAYRQSMVTVSRYRRQICDERHDVAFIPQDKYFQICSPDGDLEPFKAKIAGVTQQVREQQQAEAERQVRVAQANAQMQAAEVQQLTNSLNQFSANMNSFTQSMLNTVNQNNQYLMKQPGNGFQPQREAYDTRCIKAGIVINCTTQ